MTSPIDRSTDPGTPVPAAAPDPATPTDGTTPAQGPLPVGSVAEEETGPRLGRRSFVVRAIAAIGALIAVVIGVPVAGFASVPFFRAKTPIRLLSDAVPPTLRSTAWTSAGTVDDFKVGEPRLIPLQREVQDGWVSGVSDVAVYVVRETDTDFSTFDIHCTHLGCPLGFASGSGTFVCPCHGGSFNIQGEVLSGPPPRPMAQYVTRIVDGDVQVGPLVGEA